jgi:hypothetical protein
MGDHQLPTITMDMLRAGVAAYQRWDAEREEIEALVAAIYYSMATEAAATQVLGQQSPPDSKHRAT